MLMVDAVVAFTVDDDDDDGYHQQYSGFVVARSI